jgi:hypothetical protein
MTTRCEDGAGHATSGVLASTTVQIPRPSLVRARTVAFPEKITAASASADGHGDLGRATGTPEALPAHKTRARPSRALVTLIGWAVGGSLVVVVLSLLTHWLLTHWLVPLINSRWRLRSGNPRVELVARDREQCSTRLDHHGGEESFAVGIQGRPDTRGHQMLVEVTR